MTSPKRNTLGLHPKMVATDQIKPNPHNARNHSKKQICQIADSMSAFGFTSPVLIDENGVLLAGHGRLEAAKFLGLKAIPAIVIDGFPRQESGPCCLADNRIAQNAGWDREQPGDELPQLAGNASLEGLDISDYWFRAGRDRRAPGRLRRRRIGSCRRPRSRAPCRPGGHADRATFGSSANIVFFAAMHAMSVAMNRLMGAERATWHSSIRPTTWRSGASSDAGVSSTGNSRWPRRDVPRSLHGFPYRHARHCRTGLDRWRRALRLHGLAPYRRTRGAGPRGLWRDAQSGRVGEDQRRPGQFLPQPARAHWRVPGRHSPHLNTIELGRHGRSRSNVWRYAGANTFRAGRLDDLRAHPTVKPVAMIADAIKDCTRRDQIVLDTFCGSGTTILAAERVGRMRSRRGNRPALCRCCDPALAGLYGPRRGARRNRSDLRRNRCRCGPIIGSARPTARKGGDGNGA